MKNIQVTKTGLVIVNKNNRINVYTLKEYTDSKFYIKLYDRTFKLIALISTILIPSYMIHLLNK